MRVFLTGVSCVGKTTIGRRLAELLHVSFFDLDQEVEAFFGTSIERLQRRFLTMHSYRSEAAKALVALGSFLRAVRGTTGITIALTDDPENILKRITFYDIDSKLIEMDLTAEEMRLQLREIKKDITYFRKTYERAHLQVDISGLDVEGAACKVKEAVQLSLDREPGGM